MSPARPPGTVFVSGPGGGRTCPKCGWPVAECHCSDNLEQKVPERIVAKLRVEKAGRGGKTVTVVDGLPRNREFLERLAADLKRACGTGGTAAETSIELQGDHRDRLRGLLAGRGFSVKG